MENAGRQVYEFISRFFPLASHRRVLVICGPGNNGGDGLVVARHLVKTGYQVTVIQNFSQKLSLQNKGFDLIVDALFGTGLSRKITGKFKAIIAWVNRQKLPVVSVDIPSGLDANTGLPIGVAVIADHTVTFGFPKTGFYKGLAHEYLGQLHVVSIGLAQQAIKKMKTSTFLIDPSCFKKICQSRASDTHKGSYGHVYTIGCSYGKIGAGVLSAWGAMKVGAGLSTLVLPRAAYTKIDLNALELMYEPVGKKDQEYFELQDAQVVSQLIKNASVVAIGPGIGTKPSTVQFVHQIIEEFRGSMIIDADGLNAISNNLDVLKMRKKQFTLLTPHPKEFSRLTGLSVSEIQNNRWQYASDFAVKWGVTLLLKGFRSVLARPNGEIWINPTGNPAMANGGQGDALTGIYAGLISQYPRDMNVDLLGCYWHGLTGDILAQKKRVVLATDILEEVSKREMKPSSGLASAFI